MKGNLLLDTWVEGKRLTVKFSCCNSWQGYASSDKTISEGQKDYMYVTTALEKLSLVGNKSKSANQWAKEWVVSRESKPTAELIIIECGRRW